MYDVIVMTRRDFVAVSCLNDSSRIRTPPHLMNEQRISTRISGASNFLAKLRDESGILTRSCHETACGQRKYPCSPRSGVAEGVEQQFRSKKARLVSDQKPQANSQTIDSEFCLQFQIAFPDVPAVEREAWGFADMLSEILSEVSIAITRVKNTSLRMQVRGCRFGYSSIDKLAD